VTLVANLFRIDAVEPQFGISSGDRKSEATCKSLDYDVPIKS